jgi:hypothetical protein
MPRPTRKRYGNSQGGGLPLGEILAASLGGGEANPAAGAKGPGDVDFRYKGDPSEAISKFGTKPFLPNNPFQKMYGMDDADKLNKQYAVAQMEAEAALQRQLGAIPAKAAAETQAKIASDRAVRAEAAGRLAPTLSRAGILPASPLNDQAATEDFLNLYGTPAAEHGALLSYGAGEQARSVGMAQQAMQPRIPEEARAEQGAKISKGKLDITAAEQERGARNAYESDVYKGLRAHFGSPARAEVGGVLYPDINDLSNFISAIPPQHAGINPMTGVYDEAAAPSPIIVKNGIAITPKKVGAPAPPAGGTKPPAGAPAASAPTASAGALNPTLSGPAAQYQPIKDTLAAIGHAVVKATMGTAPNAGPAPAWVQSLRPSLNPPAQAINPVLTPPDDALKPAADEEERQRRIRERGYDY